MLFCEFYLQGNAETLQEFRQGKEEMKFMIFIF